MQRITIDFNGQIGAPGEQVQASASDTASAADGGPAPSASPLSTEGTGGEEASDAGTPPAWLSEAIASASTENVNSDVEDAGPAPSE